MAPSRPITTWAEALASGLISQSMADFALWDAVK
jgi:hypothetical protein